MHCVNYSQLEWDSNFFGFPVGVVYATEKNSAEIHTLLGEIVLSPPCRLLYIHVNPVDALTRNLVTLLGARLVDNRVVFQKSINSQISANIFSVCKPFEEFNGHDSTELNELAFLAGRYSRFQVDPGISESDFKQLYSQWINRSVSGTIADKVLISRDQQNNPASLITLLCKQGVGSIGLIAVKAEQQGKGLGMQLVKYALDFFSHGLCTTAEVVTQGNNTAACQLYEKNGFTAFHSTDTYHLWLPYSSRQNN